MTAATVAAAFATSSCSDLTVPADEILTLGELLVLAQQPGAPAPPTVSFWVYNDRETVQFILHPDPERNPYLQLTFPQQTLASVAGAQVGPMDSALVTVQPRPGAYGFTLSPSTLSFTQGSTPQASFSFGVYGDASVADLSSRYATRSEYVAALDIWEEVTLNQWRVARNSTASGIDEVTAAFTAPGVFVLAAPR